MSLAARTCVDLGDRLVGQLLDLGVEALVLVLADLVLLLVGLESSMPSRRTLRTAILAFSAYWWASLASSLRRSSVRSGIGRRMFWPSMIGLMPRPALRIAFSTAPTFDAVPDLHRQHPRLGHRDGRDLVERHVGAVDLDMDRIEQGGRGAAGAQAAEIVLQRLDRAVHAALQVGLVIGRHAHPPSFCTIVAVPSPPSTRARLPCSRTLNTTIGMLLSRQSATAVASITFRLSARTLLKVTVS